MAPVLHMLVIPLPFQGHINPFLHMLARLSSPALLTTLLVPEQDSERVQGSLHNNPFVAIRTIPTSVLDVSQVVNLPSSKQLFFVLDALEQAQEGLVETIKGLEPAWSVPFCCVLLDLFVQMGQDLANRIGVPRVGLWTGGASSVLVSSCLPALISEGVIPSPVVDDLPVTCVPGLENLQRRDLPNAFFTASPGQLEKRIRISSRNQEAACVLVNTVAELESPMLTSLQRLAPKTKFLAIGPLLPSSFLSDSLDQPGDFSHGGGLWKEDVHCIDWLDQQKPGSVLYVSFGSMANVRAKQILEIAQGLELSNQPFLWVIRPNLISDMLPEDETSLQNFIARTKSQGLLISWAPQLQVLKHVSVGGFLTHCGWNSTLESVSCGVPMLCWPCFAEQHLNCKLVVDDWKIGLRFKDSGGLVDKSEVATVIKKLMQEEPGKEMKKRALELKDKVKRSVQPGGSSDSQLNTFVKLFTPTTT